MLAALAAGLVIGSFLNVVIARLPEGRSLWFPRSACPRCGTTIAWHDNIPLLSFFALRRRCRACEGEISWRYPIVEGVTGALFVAAYLAFGLTAQAAVAAALLAALVAITAIDLDHQIIPDAITLPGIVLGVLATPASPHLTWLDSILGVVVGGGLFLAIILLSGGGMGGGDMKLAAMLGAFLGWKIALVAILIAVLLGGVYGVGLLVSGRRGRKDPIPFGPFLALGGAISVFWGQPLLAWYLRPFA
jgi:leader peptidase (prepilin peptidase)/N-methyltransferase